MWLLLTACSAPPVALIEGRLPPCPNSPNCVRSEAGTTGGHQIDPLPFVEAEALVAIVKAMPRTTVLSIEGDIVRTTFTTRLVRYVDDVVFRIDREANVVHVRSASRIGYGDMGVNRHRVEGIRQALEPSPELGEKP